MSQSQHHTTESIQMILEENKKLFQACLAFQKQGKVSEAGEYQKKLHQNLSSLAILADKSVTAKKLELAQAAKARDETPDPDPTN